MVQRENRSPKGGLCSSIQPNSAIIQNENINEHKLHYKAPMPNGFWIKNDRSFRMEKWEFCRACLAAEVGRDWNFSVYKANTIHLHTEPFPVFSANRPTSILRRISLQKSLIYGLGGCRAGKSGNLATHVCQDK